LGELVIESSAETRSPDGKIKVALSSTRYPDGQAMTQAMASYGMGGAGLVALPERRVPMAFEWQGSETLIIRIPDHLRPQNLHNTQIGGAKVLVKAVPASQIPPLEWRLVSRMQVANKAEKLRRGSIIEIRSQGKTRYDYDDLDEKDPHADRLRSRGYQGGGESWAGIATGLIKLRAPKLGSKLEMDPEAEGLSVWSEDRAALLSLAKLIAEAKENATLLDAAIEAAANDGEME